MLKHFDPFYDVSCGAHFTEAANYDPLEPEKKLLTALLWRTFLDMFPISKSRKNKRVVREARTWFFRVQRRYAPAPFTFIWVCDELGLSPFRIREYAKEAIARHEEGLAVAPCTDRTSNPSGIREMGQDDEDTRYEIPAYLRGPQWRVARRLRSCR